MASLVLGCSTTNTNPQLLPPLEYRCLCCRLALIDSAACSLGRATERLMANDRMRAFSKPPGGVAPNENGGGGGDTMGEEVFGRVQQSQGEHSALASIVPEEEAFLPAPCSPGSSEAGCDTYSTCQTASSGGLGGDRGDGGTGPGMGITPGMTAQVASSNRSVALASGLGEGMMDEAEDDAVAAADWLDVSCALLEKVTESGEACR